jgi:hypothetical protein
MAPRPPKFWWTRCIAGVEASGGAKERLGGAPAVCGATWRDKPLVEKQRTRAEAGAGMARGKSGAQEVFELHELAKLFNLPDINDFEFDGEAWSQGYKEAIREGKSEDEAEEQARKWEESEQDEAFRHWKGAVEHVAEQLFEQHGMVLVEEQKQIPKAKGGGSYTLYRVAPEKSWDDAMAKILDTIHGVGMFEFASLKEFRESGPYRSSKEAVLKHLHWMKDRPEVYGTTRPQAMFDRQMRY